MGQSFVHGLDLVEREFVRIQRSTDEAGGSLPKGDDDDPYAPLAALKTNLTYSMIRKFVISDTLSVNLRHVAVIYCLDGNKDGVFSLDDLTNFVKWVYQEVSNDVPAEEFSEVVQAKASLRMWKECRLQAQQALSARDPNIVVQQQSTPGLNAVDTSDEDKDSELHDAAAVHFVNWMLIFLERNFPPQLPVGQPSAQPRCGIFDASNAVPEAPNPHAQLPGAVEEDYFLSSITSFHRSTTGFLEQQQQRDGVPILNVPQLQLPIHPQQQHHQREDANDNKTGSNDSVKRDQLDRFMLSIESAICVFQLLHVRESYGMSFTQFSRVLMPVSLRQACSWYLDDIPPIEKAGEADQPFWVSKMALVPLLTSFIRSYWRILNRLGLGCLV